MSSTEPPQSADSRVAAFVAVSLLAVALALRLPGLGNLSLYGDEDLSMLAAAATVETGNPVLPSGMEYRRGLPLTWLNAISIRALGDAGELSVRLPTALMGALTVPVLFLFGRRWIGFSGGLVAALLMAFSEWHIAFSRYSRMYVPLLFFLILATWAYWNWTTGGRRRDLLYALAATAPVLALHQLGIVVAGAPLMFLAFPGALAIPAGAVVAVSVLVAFVGGVPLAGWITRPYDLLPMAPPLQTAATPDPATGFAWLSVLPVALAVAGVALGILVAIRTRPEADDSPGRWLRLAAHFGLAAATGLAAGTGQIHGLAVAGALFLILGGRGILPMWQRARWPTVGLLLLPALPVATRVLRLGLVEGLEASAAIPFPHGYTLAQQSPVFVAAFGLITLLLVLRPIDRGRRGEAAAALLAICYLTAVGFVVDAGPTRYLLPVYPFMLLVIGGGLFRGSKAVVERVAARSGGWMSRADAIATVFACAIVLSGVIGGYGIATGVTQLRLQHGEPVNALIHMFPFHPDHRAPGRFVRENRRGGDLVVAEDPLVQAWYAGPIDYWFRRYPDMRRFLRVHEDGRLRDIYAGSAPLPDPATLDSIVAIHAGRVWFITSGETTYATQYYLSPEQSTWLDSLRSVAEPVVQGEDGRSALYCLNCAVAPLPEP